MKDHDWVAASAIGLVVYDKMPDKIVSAAAILINRTDNPTTFHIPELGRVYEWRVAFSTCDNTDMSSRALNLPAHSLSLLLAN